MMIPARIIWLASILGAFSLAGILIAWPEIRGLCSSCSMTSVTGVPSNLFVRVQHASDIDNVFAKQLGGDPFLGNIPRVFVQALPSDLDGIADVERRKRLFLQVLLPQILQLNENIRADRARLIAIAQTPPDSQSAENTAWLVRVAKEYQANPADYAFLLARVDVVPPSLAIAQGAIESGWGTSRFALTGNALFGQRTFDLSHVGFRPKEVKDANFKVRRFESLMDSIWGYMITLNTHPAHARFRQLRAQMRQENVAINSMALAGTLMRYSEDGERYVSLVQNVISENNLRRLDDRRLSNSP